MSLKKYSLFLSSFLFSGFCFAHGAHEHGVAKIDIAIDGKITQIHFEVPAISLYGFEHEVKNEKEKAIVKASMDKLKNNITKMFIISSSSMCKLTSLKIEEFVKEAEPEAEEILFDAEHGNVVANFTFTCQNTLAGQKIKFAFNSFFPAIQKLKIQALSDKLQKGAVIDTPEGEMQL